MVEVNGRNDTEKTEAEMWKGEEKEERDERIQEMPKDSSDDQETLYELQVHKARLVSLRWLFVQIWKKSRRKLSSLAA